MEQKEVKISRSSTVYNYSTAKGGRVPERSVDGNFFFVIIKYLGGRYFESV